MRADELGADMKGSWNRRSCGEIVAMLAMELDALPLKSKTEATAGEEKAVWAPPSKAVNSSSSTSDDDGELVELLNVSMGYKPAAFIILAVCCGTLPVLWEKRGTGGRAARFCLFNAVDDEGAEEA